MLTGFLLSISVSLVFFYAIWMLDVYGMVQRPTLILANLWGALSFILAFLLHSALLSGQILDEYYITLTLAPILEELLKVALLIYLSLNARIRYPVEGAVYGFTIGLSFALAENILYINNQPENALGIAAARTISATLLHSSLTATLGGIIGSRVFLVWTAQRRYITTALIGAIIVHLIYNAITLQMQGIPLLLTAFVIGVIGLLVTLWHIRHSLHRQAAAINAEVQKYLTPGEQAAVLRPENLVQALKDARANLPPAHARNIEEYITLQAQRAMIQKNIARSQRSDLVLDLNSQLRLLDEKLSDLRNAMGLYTWIWLRSILPSDESDLWHNLVTEMGDDSSILLFINMLVDRRERISPEVLAVRVAWLRNSDLFATLGDTEREDLALLMDEQHRRLDDVLIQEGTVSEHLYCVVRGSLLGTTTDPNGAELIITTFTPGDTIGELSMIDQAPHPMSVTCIEPCTLYSIHRADFIALIYAKPQVALSVMKQLTAQIRQHTQVMNWISGTTPLPFRPDL